MYTNKNSFYFVTTLISPKIKYRLINFSKNFKLKISHSNFSFRKSLSRFSYKISTKLSVKLSTLTKIKNKIFFKNFIFNLFLKNNWLSIAQIDIFEKNFRSSNRIKKILIDAMSLNKDDIEIILTNRIINKIFKIFSTKLSCTTKKSTFFLEKYFSKQKYVWTIGISNNLNMFILKYFSFFINSSFSLKKLFLFDKKITNFNYFLKLKNFKNLFLNKRFYIFFNNKCNFKMNEILFKTINCLNLTDYIIFTNGYVLDSTQHWIFFLDSNFTFIKTVDNDFIDFFLIANRKILQNNNFLMENKFNNSKIWNKKLIEIFLQPSLYLDKFLLYYSIFIILNNLIFLKIKLFRINFFFKIFI